MSRLLIFEDSAFLRAPVQSRDKVSKLGTQLADTIGALTDDEVAIIRAMEALRELKGQILRISRPTSIIDVTGGVLSSSLECFGDIPVFNLGLSRVRKLDDKLSGQGFLLRGDWNQASTADLSRPLLLDDVNWSGRSIIEVMSLLGVETEQCIVGNLTTNWGMFGNKEGGGKLLQNMGVLVLSGSNVSTPEDDGFHLEDFSVNNGEKPFQRILTLDELRDLKQRGVFLDRAGLPKSGTAEFGINPNNLLMPSFQKRVRIDSEALDELLEIGRQLHDAMNDNNELGTETKAELKLC